MSNFKNNNINYQINKIEFYKMDNNIVNNKEFLLPKFKFKLIQSQLNELKEF